MLPVARSTTAMFVAAAGRDVEGLAVSGSAKPRGRLPTLSGAVSLRIADPTTWTVLVFVGNVERVAVGRAGEHGETRNRPAHTLV
jgi:hypothetical protein